MIITIDTRKRILQTTTFICDKKNYCQYTDINLSNLIKNIYGTLLRVQWLGHSAFTAVAPRSILGQGTKIPKLHRVAKNKQTKKPNRIFTENLPSISFLMMKNELSHYSQVQAKNVPSDPSYLTFCWKSLLILKTSWNF